ncbi:hypothetical protein MCERE85_00420 [Candidatus Nanopelagicaceae bacterium]
MKKLAAIVSVLFLVLSVQPANAAAKVKVANSSKISTKTGLVSITVSGLPKEHGIYISQCMGIDKGKTEPAACNPAKASKLWVSNVPADLKMGATPGTGRLSIKVDKYFKDGDCIHTKCIIYVTNDHNATDKSFSQAIPFKFGGINLF